MTSHWSLLKLVDTMLDGTLNSFSNMYRGHYCAHFTDGETEAQRQEVTCPGVTERVSGRHQDLSTESHSESRCV